VGRTLPTFVSFLIAEEESWRPYRRALRAEEKAAFDRLFSHARAHSAAAGQAARGIPSEAMFLSMLLEMNIELEALRRELAALRAEREAARGEAP